VGLTMGAKEQIICAWIQEEAKKRSSADASREFGPAPPLIPFANMDFWFLTTPVKWINRNTLPQLIEIPRGFVTDFASVPRPLWWLFPRIGSYGLPSIMHDWLYWQQDVPRKTADHLFRVAMAEMGTPAWSVLTIFSAIRVFGWIAWKSNARAKASGNKRILVQFPSDSKITWIQWRSIPGVFA
jgi:hypothetical protein